ncbi:MAG: ATP-binding cassette domain-containing protein [Bacilli bacterium]|jgi:putative ABC transport system permease protein|nr:ATP-binding cassette domain-containing protein [Bacilli bacterium]
MLELKNIKKSYTTGTFTQHALKGVDLKFRSNEFVAILGPSGSGKTTLLNIVGGLDRYDQGDLVINNRSTKLFKDSDWDAYRNNCIGFIFQSYNLINHIDILSNVEMGMTLSGVNNKARRKKALEVLKKVGLKEHAHKKPNQLSGGQMQRVAIARALANDPDIILADEPTGALDSKTSVQIMELIKEIAKDKLVIMVTHNPELAYQYANRVIEMKDGELIKDSNPWQEEKSEKEDYQIKKTSMNFKTALHLSLNNIKTKKGRTILTAFASSIGVIGISLILSLSNGFDKQINHFEKNTLSALPIIISKQSMNLDEETMSKMQDEMGNKAEDYPNFDYVIPTDSQKEQYTHENKIQKDYIEYIENISEDYVSGINYIYGTGLNILQKIDNKVKQINTTELNIGMLPHTLGEKTPSVIKERFDLLIGKEPEQKDEIIVEVDSKNRISKELLEVLGFKTEEHISFQDLLRSEITLVWNDDYYIKNGIYFMPNQNLENIYQNKNNLKLKVVGIIRLKEDYPNMASSPGIYYTYDLMKEIQDKNTKSQVVEAQKKADFSVLTGEKFDMTSEDGKLAKENVLTYLGDLSIPYMIQVYPKDFESKEYIISYLDQYNNDKKEEDKIAYIDQANLMSSLSSNIMDAITIVLVAFSSISLIVSSIMIGIIMYISVLERTKEIGILRSLGARKKDIARVFNSETFIIGVSSGLLGILVARVLLFPTNHLLKELTSLDNVAIMNPLHALILITISVILTLIGGWIPAKLASKKDPVEALRTE